MAIESQNFKLEMETGTGGAVTITAIALQNPTMLTAVAHGLSNGDVVTAANFAGDDAADINGNEYVVKYVTDDTFCIELDSTDLDITDNTGAATVTPKAFTEIGEVVDVNPSDPGAAEIQTTHLQSTVHTFMVGLQKSGTYTLDLNWSFNDAGQQALAASKAARSLKSYKATYSDGTTGTFDAYVQTISGPNVAVDDKLSGSVTLLLTTIVTFA